MVPTRTFANGETIVVYLDGAGAPAVYVGIDSGGVGFEVTYPYSSPVDAECVIWGDSQDMALLHPERNVALTVDGVEWRQVFLIRVPQPGDYELRCTGDGVRFGVAKDLPGALHPLHVAAGRRPRRGGDRGTNDDRPGAEAPCRAYAAPALDVAVPAAGAAATVTSAVIALLRAFTGESDRDFVAARIAEIRELLDDEALASAAVRRPPRRHGRGLPAVVEDLRPARQRGVRHR